MRLEGIIVFCRADDYFRLKLANYQGEIINSNDFEILKMLECEPEEKGEAFNKKYYEIMEKVKEEFEKEANEREQDKKYFVELEKKEFEKLIDWLKRKENNKIKKEGDELLNLVKGKELNFQQRNLIKTLARKYKKRWALKKEEILKELNTIISKELANAPPIKKPEIKPKYAEIIIAEELKS